jgi:hypothetical protein
MDVTELVEMVRQSRERTAGVLPLPDVPGCVDYAITEAGETLDAKLRMERTGDKRNHAKDADMRKEWGQTGYMIASAMIQVDGCPMEANVYGGTIHTVLWALAMSRITEDFGYLVDALTYWVGVCSVNHWSAAELLTETCAAFERKHLHTEAQP